MRFATALAAAASLVMLGAAMAIASPAAPDAQAQAFGMRRLSIPRPDGFQSLDSLAPELNRVLAGYLPASNRLVDTWVDPDNLAKVQAGHVKGLDPYFQVQVLRASDGLVLSSTEFARESGGFVAQIEAALADSGRQLAAQAEAGNRQAKDQLGVDPGVAIAAPKFLGAYRTEPSGVFFSITSSVSTTDGNGHAQTIPMAASNAIVLVNHQMLFLNAYRYDDGRTSVQWTRDALDRWAAALHAANPDDPTLEAKAKPLGFDLGAVGMAGFRGALIGALIGLVLFGIRKFRKS